MTSLEGRQEQAIGQSRIRRQKRRGEIDRHATPFAPALDLEIPPGITGIAVAVMHGTALLGALNLAVPTSRFTDEQAAVFRRELRSVGGALAQALRP